MDALAGASAFTGRYGISAQVSSVMDENHN